MPRTALIAGAGIGGLAAGIALRQAGWHIRIFERADSPRELGFGLALAPNAMAALRELGVADAVLARGSQPRRGEFRRPDGTVLKRAELPPEALSGPMLIALRAALHGSLLETVGSEAIELSSEAVGFSQTATGVTLQLANGQADGDLLIGADGMGSVLRRILHPSEPPPRFSGIVTVRGAVHGVVHHLGTNEGIYYMGPGIESMLLRASGDGIYWFIGLARELVPPAMHDPAEVIAHMAPRFDRTFNAVTGATEDMRFDELFDRDPIESWGTGRVTLLGDAAHPMLPHTGQGAAQAIVDGVALGRALAGGVDVEPALRAYERERWPKTAALVRQGRRTAALMGMTNPVGCAIREAVLRMMPVTTFAKLYIRINRRAGTDARYSS